LIRAQILLIGAWKINIATLTGFPQYFPKKGGKRIVIPSQG
jgi:hypothetical protein